MEIAVSETGENEDEQNRKRFHADAALQRAVGIQEQFQCLLPTDVEQKAKERRFETADPENGGFKPPLLGKRKNYITMPPSTASTWPVI